MPLDTTNWPQTAEVVQDEATALLIRARALVERGWCRDAFARDAARNPVPPTSERAVAWDAFGALLAAGLPENRERLLYRALDRLQNAIPGDGIIRFNNQQGTVQPILDAFDRAIAGEPPPSADERPKGEPAARIAGRDG